MAKKRKVAVKAIAKEVEEPTNELETLGLEKDQEIRFRRSAGQTWTKAKIKGVSKDGSLMLIDDAGMWRSIMPDLCQTLHPKPKRGFEWKPLSFDLK